MMFCPDCNTRLDDVPVSEACPGCGGHRRSVEVTAQAAGALAMAKQLSVSVTKENHGPWTEKWLTVLQCLAELRAAYAGDDAGSRGNVEIDGRAMTFFVECTHVADWLTSDPALVGVTHGDIERLFQQSKALSTCRAICNTHKHHTRSSGTTARTRSTSLTPVGARVTIEVNWASPSAWTVDALGLAEDCVKAWRGFFASFGITEP